MGDTRDTAEDARVRSREGLLEAILDQLPYGVIVADGAGDLVLENRAAIQIWRGSPTRRDLEGWSAYRGREADGTPFRGDLAMGRCLAHGAPALAHHIAIERFDGSRGVVLASCAPIRDASGAVTGAVGVFADITDLTLNREELERAHAQLADQQRWLEAVLDRMPQPLVLLDPATGRTTFSNAAAERIVGAELANGTPLDGYFTDSTGHRLHDDERPSARAARGEQLDGLEMDWHTRSGVTSLVVYSATLPSMQGHPATVVMPFVDVTALKRAELHQELVADVSRILAGSLEREGALEQVAERMTRRFVDLADIELIDEEGTANSAAFSHADPAMQEIFRATRAAVPLSRANSAILRQESPSVVVSTTDEILAQVTDDAAERELLRGLGTDAVVLVPLQARGKLLGMLALARNRGRRAFDERDVEVAKALANRIVIALDNLRLYARLESANRRLALLQEVTDAALSHPTVDSLCLAAVAGVRAALGADTADILLARPDGDFEVVACDGLAGEHEHEVRVPVTQGIAGDVLAARAPRIVSHLGDADVARPFLRSAGITSLMVAPLGAGERALGVLEIGTVSHRSFANDELLLLQLLADRTAVGIERLRLLEAERSARAEAEAANRVKDDFLATLSHELRTPLNAIVGWTALLQARTGDLAATTRGLAIIERNAKSQAKLIEDLLDVSRIVSGKLRLTLDEVDVRAQVMSAVDAVRPAAESKELSLAVTLDDVGRVIADPDRLQQIVWNLLSNAVKFTPKGGAVEISASRIGTDLRIVVRDTGLGIPQDELPYVFERFRQVNGSASRVHGGLGLGLAIVRHLVELHGGTVEASSAGAGKGSTFMVVLPLREAQPRPSRETARPTAAVPSMLDRPLRGVRVLAVDDDDDARELLSRILSEYGADVITAPSARAAFEAAERAPLDVIVCDIGMPEEDGISFMKRLRASDTAPSARTPAVALTAYARDDDVRRALSAGFQLHVAKPVEPMRVVGCVARLAGRGADGAPRMETGPIDRG